MLLFVELQPISGFSENFYGIRTADEPRHHKVIVATLVDNLKKKSVYYLISSMIYGFFFFMMFPISGFPGAFLNVNQSNSYKIEKGKIIVSSQHIVVSTIIKHVNCFISSFISIFVSFKITVDKYIFTINW